MSRIAKSAIIVPASVEVEFYGQNIMIKGKKGKLSRTIHESVKVDYTGNRLSFLPREGFSDGWTQAGTTRSLLKGMIIGVTEGFTKKLYLVGVGYRAGIENNSINLSLGFSHPVEYILPKGISAICPSQEEIILEGTDKQLIGHVAAELCALRPLEPYKGKGIRCSDKIWRAKEAKKK